MGLAFIVAFYGQFGLTRAPPCPVSSYGRARF